MPTEPLNRRQALLDAAQRLILDKGFPATRVDEVCAEAGVTKGAFYHHFASKDELAAAIIDHYFDGITEGFMAGGWHGRTEPTERLRGFLDNAIKVARGPLLEHGCVLGSFALDLSKTHPAIRREIEERFERLAKVVEAEIRAAMKHQGVSTGVTAPALARQFLSVIEGGIVLGKAYDDFGKVAEGLRCYRSMLEALLGL